MNKPRADLPPVDAEVWSLVESFVEGTATEEQCRRLETHLSSDESVRQFYVAYLDLHAQLQWRTRGKSDRAAESAAVGTVVETSNATSAVKSHRRLLWSSLAAICSLTTAAIVFLTISLPRRGPEDAETPDLPLKPAGSVAVLIDNSAPVWEAGTSGPMKTGSYLLPGRLRLKSGIVEI